MLDDKDFLLHHVSQMVDSVEYVTPVDFNQEHRYIPEGVSPKPGFINFDTFPYFKEILNCFDVSSPVREVSVMKGVQVGYTTILESVMLYYIGHVKTESTIFMTAEKDMAHARVENNILPMLHASEMMHLVRTLDEGNSKKSGKTRDFIQFEGGGKMFIFGARNASKMRQNTARIFVKDEIDGWPVLAGKDGSPDKLTDARMANYWESRKIFRGSTPSVEPSMIGDAYRSGDRRKYMVLCLSCSFPQELRQENVNKESGIIGGFHWETEGGVLIKESVNYACVNCGHKHFEYDKTKLFSTNEGAHWKPTSSPTVEGARSYHLPAFYSPVGFQPWYKNIEQYLEAFDVSGQRVKDIGKFQVYYNNILGMPFKKTSGKIKFEKVSRHRRDAYRLGEIPNEYAESYAGSKILFLTCQVDVQKEYLAVAVMGWTQTMNCFLIDYWHIKGEGKDDTPADIRSSTWLKLDEIIIGKEYKEGENTYKIAITLVDSGFSTSTVMDFCDKYAQGVYPIKGVGVTARGNNMREFEVLKTTNGGRGYKINVNYYKDRNYEVLKREWREGIGDQYNYHFNAPLDATDDQLLELTREYKTEINGVEQWNTPKKNELWDLLIYGHAAVEIHAYHICIDGIGMKKVDWIDFWKFAAEEKNNRLFSRG